MVLYIQRSKPKTQNLHTLSIIAYSFRQSPTSGGETHFPSALGGLEQNLKAIADKGLPSATSLFSLGVEHGLQCNNVTWGLKVQPVRGSALLLAAFSFPSPADAPDDMRRL